MTTDGQQFYGTSVLSSPYTREDVLAGRVIRLSPALITILDGRTRTDPPDLLRGDVLALAGGLLRHNVRSLHVDVNFDDYGGYGSSAPEPNAHIFTPDFVNELAHIARAYQAFVTLHLLTDFPARHLHDFAHTSPGAVCFQLDAMTDPARLITLVEFITALGACPSPVIETVGSDRRAPLPPEAVRALLEPVWPAIGMLTLQAAGTAARSHLPAGAFNAEAVAAYLAVLDPGFAGTLQLQGGITQATIGTAVSLSAEFVVAGTSLFRHQAGLAPFQVVALMLDAAAAALFG